MLSSFSKMLGCKTLNYVKNISESVRVSQDNVYLLIKNQSVKYAFWMCLLN